MAAAYGVAGFGAQSGMEPLRTIVGNALRWKIDSDELIQRSAAAANQVHPGRFIWVEPGIRDENSAFAPRPWVFGVRLPQIAPEDDVADERRAQSTIQPDADLRAFAVRASVGHPNRWGARAYFDSIYPVLQKEYGL